MPRLILLSCGFRGLLDWQWGPACADRSSTSGSLFSHVDLEERDPAKHPLRTIRSLVNEVLYAVSTRV
jgi:hypothetical protein